MKNPVPSLGSACHLGPFAAAVLLAAASSPSAADYYVDGTNGHDSSPGTSRGLAWRTIRHALASLPPGTTDTVHVAAGLYDGVHGETFPLDVREGISLVGEGSGATTIAGEVAFRGDGPDRLEGFRITGGAVGVEVSGSPTLRGLVVTAASGDGLHVQGHPTIVECELTGNGGSGIGLFVRGGFTFGAGGGLTLVDTRITANGLDGIRQYAEFEAYVDVSLVRCVVSGNAGWGIFTDTIDLPSPFNDPIFSLRAEGCLLAGNGVGAISMAPPVQRGIEAMLRSSTVVDNGGHGLHLAPTLGAELRNSILWGNGNDVETLSMQPIVEYCDVESIVYGGTNLSLDPGFVDRAGGDHHLAGSSPLIDAGDPAQPPAFPPQGYDVDVDPRRLDGDLDGAARIDIGYDERNLVALTGPATAPFGASPRFELSLPAGWGYALVSSPSTGERFLDPFGSLLLGSPWSVLQTGIGPAAFVLRVPRGGILQGEETYLQPFALAPGAPVGAFGNRVRLVVGLPAAAYHPF